MRHYASILARRFTCGPLVSICVIALSPRTVRRYRQRWRERGTLDPTPHPGRHRKIRGVDEAALREQVLAAPDATLREHRLQWHARTGVWVSESTLCRALQRLELTVKKNT